MNFKLKLTFVFVLFQTAFLMAQSVYSVSGTVTSKADGETLPGVTVLRNNGESGTSTDFDGKYEIEVTEGDVLSVSFIGFATQNITITNQTVLDVVLAADVNLLEDIVIIGYGTQKKANLTGSISKVSSESLDQIPTARVDDALVGQVAGVNIQSTNPAAGEAPTIKIRGQGSISFDSAPLIVVDGIAVGNDADYLASIDMNDVESMSILKDASSASIYGSRGANGVILITTKGGEEGPTKFSFNSYLATKWVPKNDVLTSVDEWSKFVESHNGELTDRMKYINKIGNNTDWQDVIMDGGTIQNYNFSARGGSKTTKFRASLGMQNDQGVLLTDEFQKYNMRLNLDTKVNDYVEFGVMINPSYTKQRRFPVGLHDAIRQSSWLPLYVTEENMQYVNKWRDNGKFADTQVGDYAQERMFDDYDLDAGAPSQDPGTGGGTDISTTSNTNPIAKILERERYKYQTKVYANSYLKVNIIPKSLTFKQTIGADYRNTKNDYWTGTLATRNGVGDSEMITNTTAQYHIISESTLNYNKEVGKHRFDVVAGFAYEYWNREYSSIEAAGYNFDYIKTIPGANVTGAETSIAEEALMSVLARANYSYDDRYLFSGSLRYDGSSKFGPDTKYGLFPSASVGWRISNESFLEDSDIIDELKLRASYGVTGSKSGIDEYDHIGQLTPVGTGLSGINTGYNQDNIANTLLGWEQLVEFNPGVDVVIYNGRFGMSVDYYNRLSNDLLLNLPIPSATGFETALVNKGQVRNEGFEFELTARPIMKNDFSWNITGILSKNTNTLVDFSGASGLISSVDSKRPAEWIAQEGQPISSFYGYVVDKEIDLADIKNPYYPINAQSQDIYVKDINGDGLIDTDDRTILGSPYPDFVWSLTNDFKYKDFDFNFMFQGSHGAEVRNIEGQYINNEFSSNQDTNADAPNKDFTVQRIFTSDDVMDASYVALRNISLGYTLPKDLVSKAGINKLRFYASAQNLLYIMADGYTGYNPEGINQGLDSPLTYGYQRGAAPIYTTLSIGVNLEF